MNYFKNINTSNIVSRQSMTEIKFNKPNVTELMYLAMSTLRTNSETNKSFRPHMVTITIDQFLTDHVPATVQYLFEVVILDLLTVHS